MKCEICGKEIEDGAYVYDKDGNKIYICQECLEEDYVQCEECGEYLLKNSGEVNEIDGKILCEDCVNDLCIEAYDDGELHLKDNCEYISNLDIWVYSEDWLSYEDDVMWDDYAQDYYWRDDGEYVGDDWYSYSTLRNNSDFICCAECGEWLYTDDAYYYERTDCYLCESCYNEVIEEENEEMEIRGYHGDDGFYPIKLEGEDEPIFYIGHETEVEHRNDSTENQRDAIQVLNENLNCYLEHDGSLNYGGFEIVSQPQSYEYYMANYGKYKEAFDTLRSLGYISHDSDHCGLHFHVSAPKENRDQIVNRLWLIIENYKEQFEKLSRRKGDFHWCRFLSNETGKECKSVYKIAKVYKNTTRYLVINNENSRTIEIRIFKGTLNVDTFYANLQLVNNLFKLAYDTSINIEDITFDKLIEGEYISRYCEENEIYSDARIVDDSLKYITLENKILKYAKQVYNAAFKELAIFRDSFDINVNVKNFNRSRVEEIQSTMSKYARKLTRLADLKSSIDQKDISYSVSMAGNIIDYMSESNMEEIKNGLAKKYAKMKEYQRELEA